MPFCNTSKPVEAYSAAGNGIKIFYRTYGHGKTKVILIIGLAGTHDSWGPQIKGLTGTDMPNEDDHAHRLGDETEDGIQVCAFDNRGVGSSSVPTKKSEYTTLIMAKDALAVMDHLRWKKAHVFGHSMGAMIACKLAAIAPDRISSLALLNVTGGGFECFPKIDSQMMSIAIRFLRAKTPEQRAAVDLDTHYTKEYLDEYVGSTTRRKILYQEYVKGISSTGMQSKYGLEGQVNACWTHKMTTKELDIIRAAGFLISVIHGRYDIIAQIYYARRLAEKLQPAARMIDLHGAHLVSHERPEEDGIPGTDRGRPKKYYFQVNEALMALIKASESNLNPQEWSNLRKKSIGRSTKQRELSPGRSYGNGQDHLACLYAVLGKIQTGFLYFFGLFVMAIEHARKILTRVKPARIGTPMSS